MSLINEQPEDSFLTGKETSPPTNEKIGAIATFFIFLKSYLGSGMMGMAAAYLAGGTILTTILIFFVACLSCVCFTMLFQVRNEIILRKSIPIEDLHFETVVEETLGKWGKIATISALVFTQAGFATAYIIFISNNLHQLYPVLTFRNYAAILIVPLTLLCWIRQINLLNPFAMAGILAFGLAIGVVSYYCVLTIYDEGIHSDFLLRMDWKTFPITFGVVIYLFEGIGLILPLEQKMRDPSKFIHVMWGVHLLVAFVVSAFGLLGYVAFYFCTKGPIILNLPSAGPLIIATIWALNVCLLFTYPIQMVPVFQIAEDALIKNIDGKENFLINLDQDDEKKSSCSKLINKKNKFLISSMIIRAAIVLLSVGCAAVIPYFDLFLSLIGGLGSAQLMFIIPPLVYLACFKELKLITRIGCYALLVFGILTLLVTTIFTCIQIVQEFTGQRANNTQCNATI